VALEREDVSAKLRLKRQIADNRFKGPMLNMKGVWMDQRNAQWTRIAFSTVGLLGQLALSLVMANNSVTVKLRSMVLAKEYIV